MKVAVIGCGTIANSAHIPSYLKNPDAQIKYFCDILPERASAAVEKYGCGIAVADYRDAPALEEALYILVQSYDQLGMDDLRDDARRVIDQNYPDSPYFTRGFKAANKPWWQLW
jgi:outer membrane protein assembly factor BamD (BamD/ComL family)